MLASVMVGHQVLRAGRAQPRPAVAAPTIAPLSIG